MSRTKFKNLFIAMIVFAPMMAKASEAVLSDVKALCEAAKSGNIVVIKALLQKKVAVNASDECKNTALIYAAGRGKLKAIEVLIEGGADKNQWRKDRDGDFFINPLHAAALAGEPVALRILISKYGADSAALDSMGNTLLHNACWQDSAEAISALIIEFGFNPNALNKRKSSPLHVLMRQGGQAAINILLDAKANIDAQDNAGETPLHCAVKCENIIAVAALLERNATIVLQDRTGLSPVAYAFKKQLTPIVWLFKKHQEAAKAVLQAKTAIAEVGRLKLDLEKSRRQTEHEIALRAKERKASEMRNVSQEVIKREAAAALLAKMKAPKMATAKIAKSNNNDEESEARSQEAIGRTDESISGLDE